MRPELKTIKSLINEIELKDRALVDAERLAQRLGKENGDLCDEVYEARRSLDEAKARIETLECVLRSISIATNVPFVWREMARQALPADEKGEAAE